MGELWQFLEYQTHCSTTSIIWPPINQLCTFETWAVLSKPFTETSYHKLLKIILHMDEANCREANAREEMYNLLLNIHELFS